MPCISFSGLSALARTSGTMLNRSGESTRPWLITKHRREEFSLLPLRMMKVTHLSLMSFIRLRKFPSVPTLLEFCFLLFCLVVAAVVIGFVFKARIHVGFYQMLWSNYQENCMFFFYFYLLIWKITLIGLQILN